MQQADSRDIDVSGDVATLYEDGIVGKKAAFSRDWAEAMREDMMTAFWAAIQRPGGAVGRGPRRWYVEIHPQDLGGFVELVSHPWVAAMCRSAWKDHRITSLAFNLTGVDVTEDMGPFEIAPGTQWLDGRAWKHEMFPEKTEWPPFLKRAMRKYPSMGDISCRSALTMHRGTEHGSPIARPVLVLGVDAPGAGHAELHDMMVTRDYFEALPSAVKEHLVCSVVDQLVPVTQKHDIEGLVMGATPS